MDAVVDQVRARRAHVVEGAGDGHQMPPTKTPGRIVRPGSKRSFTRRASASLPGSRSSQTSSASRTAAGASSTTHGPGREPGAQVADRGDGRGVVVERRAPATRSRAPRARPASPRRARPRSTTRASSACRPDTRTTTPPSERWSVALALPERRVVLDQLTAAGELGRGGRLLVRGRAAEPREHGAGAIRPADVERLHLQVSVRERRGHAATSAALAASTRRVTRVLASGCRRTATCRISAERAERPGEQLRKVVSGHVLDHLAARSRDRCRRRAPSSSRRRGRAPPRSGGGAARNRRSRRRRRSSRRPRLRAAGRAPASDRPRRTRPAPRPAARRRRAPRSGRPRCARRRRRCRRSRARRRRARPALPSPASCRPRPGRRAGPRPSSAAAARAASSWEAGASRVTVSEATYIRSAIPACSSGCWR